MNDWTSGYVADIGYTFGYYTELNPLRIKLAFLNAGLAFPDVNAACELGFGQGVSVNMHAAATNTDWYGTDFNPSQVGFAQELAEASGSGAKLYDAAFEEFATRTNLPDFDYIGLHGIWSWVSDENRKTIINFIKRKLKVGGVLYISYNTQSGWASFAPIRDMMYDHAEKMGSPSQGTAKRLDGAFEFIEKMLLIKPHYAFANPFSVERFNLFKDKNRSYLAHEFFNKDWQPMRFTVLADWLSQAKLGFACSAHYPDHVMGANLTTSQLEFLKEIPNQIFRENVRDFVTNQVFRRDYWVKGARQLSHKEQIEALREQRVLLIKDRSNVSLTIVTPQGEAKLNGEAYNPILDTLSDYKAKSLGEIEKALQNKGIQFPVIVEAIMVLSGCIVPVQDDTVALKLKKQTDKLNKFLMNRARFSNEVDSLVSPLAGGGIACSRFSQLFLLAQHEGIKQSADWVQFVWKTLMANGQKIVVEGKVLESEAESIEWLSSQAAIYINQNLPILKALHMV